MSDTDQPDQGPDFRGSREERRQDETVMLNADNLSDMVDEAKSPGAPGPTPQPTAPPAASGESEGPNMTLVVGIVLIIVIFIGLGMYWLL